MAIVNNGIRTTPTVGTGDVNPNGGSETPQTQQQTLQGITQTGGVLATAEAGGADAPQIAQGTGDQAPNPGGAGRSRLEKVADFFGRVADKIGNGLSDIKSALSKAADKIGAFFHSLTAAGRAEARHDAQQTTDLAKGLDNGVGSLETAYQDHLATLDEGAAQPSREDFLTQIFDIPRRPWALPQGDPRNVASRIDGAIEQMEAQNDPGKSAMKDALASVLQDRPMVDGLMDWAMKKDLSVVAEDVTTLFRGNSAYTKLTHYVASETFDLAGIGDRALQKMETSLAAAQNSGVLKDDTDMAWGSMTRDVADALVGGAREYLENLLDLEDPKSFSNLLSDEMRTELGRASDAIGGLGVDADLEAEGIRKTFISHLFLRGASGDAVSTLSTRHEGMDRTFHVRTMQLVQVFLNGADPSGKYNDEVVASFREMQQDLAPQLESFLTAAGMPQA